MSRHKPIVAVKAGRTGAGRRAASSHTAALAAGETVVEALFHQAGVIRAATLKEMFDVGAVLSTQPVPAGRRVAVLTNGGGPGILVADACEAAGLLVPELSDDTQAKLRAGLPPQASVKNPVDTVASATAAQYGQALRLLGAAEEIDAIIAVYIPAFVPGEDIARTITAAADALPAKPVIAVFLTAGAAPASLADAGIPAFTYPEQAAAALGQIARWAEWRARPPGHIVTPPGIHPGRGRAVVGKVLAGEPGGGWASAEAAAQLLAAYGIPAARSRLVRTPAEAAAAQAELGGPVVVKIAAAIHKSDVGGVALSITTPQAAADAVVAIRARLADAGIAGHAAEFLVQEQIRDGVEMIVGVTHDPAFGPLVLAGLGGTMVELLGDVAVRITPLSDTDVDEMLRSLRSYRLLTGYRQSPPLDVAAFAELLHRVSAMVEDIPRSPSSTSTRCSSSSTAPSSLTCASASPGDEPRAVPGGLRRFAEPLTARLQERVQDQAGSTRSWPGRRPSSLRSGGPGAGTPSAGLPDGSGTGWVLAAMTTSLDGSSQYGLPSLCCAATWSQRAKVPDTAAE